MGILWNGSKPSSILWSTGMNYVERNLGPINTWTIPSTTTDVVSYSGTNTISLNGKGGHYETCYKSFTVSKSGSYTISYDYDLPTINFYGTGSSHMHFGIYITTNMPPGGDMSTYSDYSTGNCNGTDICGPSSQYNTPGTGHVSFNYTLTAGTTYYLWVPMMNLADGVQTYLTFTNLNVKSVEQYYITVEPELWWNGDKIWPIYKDRYEYTIFETSNGLGVSSGTCNSNINSYDQIGILLVNTSRSVGGGEWLWFDKDGISASSGSHYIKYNKNDGTYFQTFQLVFNWNGATFSISHPNSYGWDLYTKMSDNTRMYTNNPSDMNNSVAQIVGVKYQ